MFEASILWNLSDVKFNTLQRPDMNSRHTAMRQLAASMLVWLIGSTVMHVLLNTV
jgi:hypothetical protein